MARYTTTMLLEKFSIKYEGPDIDDHTMDTEDLGVALLALGKLSRETFKAVSPADTRTPSVRVNATRPGSFIIDMSVALTVIDHIKGLFDSDHIGEYANWVTMSGLSLTAIIGYGMKIIRRRAKGESISVDKLAQEVGDHKAAERILSLSNQPHFVSAVKKVVNPLVRNEGVISFTYNDYSDSTVIISESEAHAIQQLDSDKEPTVSVVDVIATVATPHFDEPLKRKWRLKCAEYGTFMAKLLDTDFAEQVTAHRVRCDGIRFKVRLRVEELEGHVLRFEILTMSPDDSGDMQTLL
ncbi:hypothetical protein ACFLIN_03935 [Corynebacterium kutscheri]|uniref:DUF7946 domain-containing protein n=1 Tax=Corynebacterium kutscheri TaxID=35755 RepID=UPI0037C14764